MEGENVSREDNIYKNLSSQISKISKHNRQGSFKTKERYEQGVNRFCKFLTADFGIKKFANISDKHVEKYVEDMQSRGLSGAGFGPVASPAVKQQAGKR